MLEASGLSSNRLPERNWPDAISKHTVDHGICGGAVVGLGEHGRRHADRNAGPGGEGKKVPNEPCRPDVCLGVREDLQRSGVQDNGGHQAPPPPALGTALTSASMAPYLATSASSTGPTCFSSSRTSVCRRRQSSSLLT